MRHPSEIILDPNDVEMEFLDLDSARVGLAGPGEILIYAIEYKGNRYSVRLSYSDGYLYITNVFGPDYEKTNTVQFVADAGRCADRVIVRQLVFNIV